MGRRRSDHKFTAEQINQGSSALSERHLAVLRADLTGASYDQIAAAIGVAVGTVKSRLNRARAALAAALAAEPAR